MISIAKEDVVRSFGALFEFLCETTFLDRNFDGDNRETLGVRKTVGDTVDIRCNTAIYMSKESSIEVVLKPCEGSPGSTPSKFS